MHGYGIWIMTEIGSAGRSAFVFVKEAAMKDLSDTVTAKQVKDKTILVMDRSDRMRSQVASILAGNPRYKVVEASTVDECFSALGTGKVNCVVMSGHLGAKAGAFDAASLIKDIKKAPDTMRTSVLLVASERELHRLGEWKTAGATAWIIEPFMPEQLLKAVEMVMF